MDVLEFLAANADNDSVLRHLANNCQVSYTVLKRAAQNEIVLPKAIVADICRAIRLFGSNVNRGCEVTYVERDYYTHVECSNEQDEEQLLLFVYDVIDRKG